MTVVRAGAERTDPVPPDDQDDFYKRTRFWRVAGRYGLQYLLVTWGWAAALAAGGAILWLFLGGSLPGSGIKALGVAYLSLGAALFGIVLAGLAVVAAFFDADYVRELRERDALDKALFGFWWVGAVAVAALLASVTLTVVAYIDASREVTAVALALATILFVATLLEALSLVGTLMRHGLYRAELIARDFRVSRGRETGR